MTDIARIVMETEDGRTVADPSIEQLQQLIDELVVADNTYLTVSTGTSGLEAWHVLVGLGHEEDGWYQVELQDFADDEHFYVSREGAAAAAAEVMDLVAEQLV
jgi:hypothetical protein